MSKGSELLERLKNEVSTPDIEIYDPSTKIEQTTPSEPEESAKTNYVESIIKDGVEVVDVKAIEKKREKPKVDKFGIPRHPNEYRNFDRF